MLNKVQFIGHLGRDPEVRYLPSGEAICNFSVASTQKWKGRDGAPMEETEWLRCSSFERLAEVCGQYLKKGSLVYVEGSLKTRKYTDKDGSEKFSTECRLSTMKMLGGRPESDERSHEYRRPEEMAAPAPRQGNSGYGQSAPRQAPPQRQAPPPQRAGSTGSGFDDLDDGDIPF